MGRGVCLLEQNILCHLAQLQPIKHKNKKKIGMREFYYDYKNNNDNNNSYSNIKPQ